MLPMGAPMGDGPDDREGGGVLSVLFLPPSQPANTVIRVEKEKSLFFSFFFLARPKGNSLHRQKKWNDVMKSPGRVPTKKNLPVSICQLPRPLCSLSVPDPEFFFFFFWNLAAQTSAALKLVLRPYRTGGPC